jgi:hypothetical protein
MRKMNYRIKKVCGLGKNQKHGFYRAHRYNWQKE